jgi:metal-responsive CopG/Arc/MetJ family transcriptional regulator
LLREADRVAQREGRTRNELMSEAVRRYIADSKWRDLQNYGQAQARKLGLKENDVERLIHEYRSGHWLPLPTRSFEQDIDELMRRA